MATILAVDDEEDILDLLEYTLTKDGYEFIGCLDTKNVKDILDQEDVSLIIMDRNLPGIEGSSFINRLREEGYSIPVIFLSAKDSNEDILEGFDKGGDDYITKPFDINILTARVKAVLKRSNQNYDKIKIKDILYDKAKKQFMVDNIPINLTKLEHDLLLYFIKNKGIVLSREDILENVWEDSETKQLKTVNVAIKRLKEKIDPKNNKEYIKSVRGEGYIFDGE